jgi:hypothetical protein
VGDARRIRCGWMAVAQDQDGWMNASDQRWEASGRGDEGRKVEWDQGRGGRTGRGRQVQLTERYVQCRVYLWWAWPVTGGHWGGGWFGRRGRRECAQCRVDEGSGSGATAHFGDDPLCFLILPPPSAYRPPPPSCCFLPPYSQIADRIHSSERCQTLSLHDLKYYLCDPLACMT